MTRAWWSQSKKSHWVCCSSSHREEAGRFLGYHCGPEPQSFLLTFSKEVVFLYFWGMENLIFLIPLLSILIYLYFISGNTEQPDKKQEEDFLYHEMARSFMSRRDYYRHVYLKSQAWQRKRFLVLRRDNWRCVYCDGHASQVHHKKYAKNIGKEPIEWLVSICRDCHDAKHIGWKQSCIGSFVSGSVVFYIFVKRSARRLLFKIMVRGVIFCLFLLEP